MKIPVGASEKVILVAKIPVGVCERVVLVARSCTRMSIKIIPTKESVGVSEKVAGVRIGFIRASL